MNRIIVLKSLYSIITMNGEYGKINSLDLKFIPMEVLILQSKFDHTTVNLNSLKFKH